MAASRVEILCSPCSNDDAFLTWGSDLCLYRVEEASALPGFHDDLDVDLQAGFFRLSSRFCAYAVGRTREFKFIKSVAWCPRMHGNHLHPQPPIVAVGLASGQVVLTSFSQNQDLDIALGVTTSATELAPKHQRQCNGVAFSHVDPMLLAAGFDKHRSDHAIVIWDASAAIAGAASSPSPSVYLNSATAPVGGRIVGELGMSEQCNSLAWFHFQPKTLIAGMSGKHLKMFDLRDSQRQVQSSPPTKAVLGVCVDPFVNFRFASYTTDNVVVLWDRRNLERPLMSIGEKTPSSPAVLGPAGPVTKLAWCPTRSGLLATSSKDSPFLRTYDLHSWSGQESGLNVLERTIWPTRSNAVSFSWSSGPSAGHFLVLTSEGAIVDHEFAERLTVTWSPDGEVAWTSEKRQVHVLSRKTCDDHKSPQQVADVLCDVLADDISYTMKKRASMKYGLLSGNLAENGNLVEDGELKSAWEWMESSQRLQGDLGQLFAAPSAASSWAPSEGSQPGWGNRWQGVKAPPPHRFQVTPVRLLCKHPGIRWILCGDAGKAISKKSEAVDVPWTGLELGPRTVLARVYLSEARTFCLRLCGWGFDRGGTSLTLFLDDLARRGEFERAAAIAVFHLHVRQAMQILQKGGKRDGASRPLHLVAMALAGFTDDRNSLWRETCMNLKAQLKEPYLSAMFTFLTSDPENFHLVLEEGMAVKDNVAFALTFLPDAKLHEYVSQVTDTLMDGGVLDGLLLTGLAVNSFQTQTGQEGLSVNVSVADTQGPASDPQPVPVFNGTAAIASIALSGYTTSVAVSSTGTVQSGVALSSSAGGSSNPPGVMSGTIVAGSGGYFSSGLKLLQNYIDRTGDVQSGALMALHAAALSDERANNWFQTYRTLLDSWGLWSERCLCDVEATKTDPTNKSMPQVYVCCSFCGKGISPGIAKSRDTQRGMYIRMQGQNQAAKYKLSACPSCRKPLPRCSLCQVHLGTASGTSDLGISGMGVSSSYRSAASPTTSHPTVNRSPSKSDRRNEADGGRPSVTEKRRLSPLDSWFTWCQTCRHGGHASHMLKWFKEHSDCPVTGCSCKCLILDMPAKAKELKQTLLRPSDAHDGPLTPETILDTVNDAFASQSLRAE